jgi:PKD repeat protein
MLRPAVEDQNTSRAEPAARQRRLRGAVGAASALALLLSGCQRSLAPEEPINLRPEVNLVALPDNGPAPLEVELSANARDPEGQPLTYIWSIEGESPEAGATFFYTFEEPGEYTVELTVSDGAFDSFDQATVLVYDRDEPGL